MGGRGGSGRGRCRRKAALFQARARLGPEPLRALFERGRGAAGRAGDGGGVLPRLAAREHRRDVPRRRRHGGQRAAVRAAGLGARRGASARSRSCGWSGWASAARTRSSTSQIGPYRRRASRRWRAAVVDALGAGHAVPGRPRLLQLRAVESGRGDRRRAGMAHEVQPPLAGARAPPGRLLPLRALRLRRPPPPTRGPARRSSTRSTIPAGPQATRATGC